MSKRNNKLLLEDIIESCDKIHKYVKDYSYEDFLNDERTIDAVIRNYEIIGEAANNLSDNVYETFTEIEWKHVIGLRNKLIHRYFGVDNLILWQITTNNLQGFKEQIIKLLSLI